MHPLHALCPPTVSTASPVSTVHAFLCPLHPLYSLHPLCPPTVSTASTVHRLLGLKSLCGSPSCIHCINAFTPLHSHSTAFPLHSLCLLHSLCPLHSCVHCVHYVHCTHCIHCIRCAHPLCPLHSLHRLKSLCGSPPTLTTSTA